MPNIHAVFTACLYALILLILLTFAAVGYFLFRKYVTHAKVAAKLTDVEANITGKEQKQRLRALILPTKLDPVVHPSAARRSSRCLPSSQRVIPNPFRARSGNERPDTTTLKPDGGDNINTSIHVNDDQPSTAPICVPIPPHRPPRPTLLDDLLAGFPWEHDVARDLWFPLSNAETGNWDLCVVRGARPASRYVQGDGRSDRVLALKQEKQQGDEKSYFSIDEEEVDSTPLTPSNTLVDVVVAEKSKKSKKRDERRRKRKDRAHVFEIPELYVNARPYEEIEAEEEARASALNARSVEDEEATEMTIVIGAEEEEALAVVAAAAIVARDTGDSREACKLLEVPERFFC